MPRSRTLINEAMHWSVLEVVLEREPGSGSIHFSVYAGKHPRSLVKRNACVVTTGATVEQKNYRQRRTRRGIRRGGGGDRWRAVDLVFPPSSKYILLRPNPVRQYPTRAHARKARVDRGLTQQERRARAAACAYLSGSSGPFKKS